MTNRIALVGMACRYPDADTPAELWENVLAGRRAFRRLPPERLPLDDYWSADRAAADRTYCTEAAVLTDYEFDRVGFRVAGETFRSADWVHWLALDVACRALEDAGLSDSDPRLPRERTGVFIGNILTGEFSRASAMRLRWPYVARLVDAELADAGWEPERRATFLSGLEQRYKEPFPVCGSETLAGALANTIPGRICNHLDLKGGGYVVDGACASSTLAVAEACTALASGELDMAIAGGVDLSLDPAELIGFAKVGALADDDMRVYDRRPTGFWPGEGCGIVVLAREEDADSLGLRPYARIRGWGIASDGSGGISRPEASGQSLALGRAYERAGFGPETVAYFEGHGTGTAVGDATELEVISDALHEAGTNGHRPAIGTIKANIGHTKAAAGVAALIKATKAVESQVIPPTTGSREPHELLRGDAAALRFVPRAEPWPETAPLRAGVSAFGFGGIDTHLVVESVAAHRRSGLDDREEGLARSSQDCELVLAGADDARSLRERLSHLRAAAEWMSRAELTDLAAQLASTRAESPRWRAAIVAATPVELGRRLEQVIGWLDEGQPDGLRAGRGAFLGRGDRRPRIGLLFPGQGAPVHVDAGAIGVRFPPASGVYEQAGLPRDPDAVGAELVQLAVIAASVGALRALEALGIAGDVAVGHSVGELSALHWAGALDAAGVLATARARGRAMTSRAAAAGTMAGVSADDATLERLVDGLDVALACFNSPTQRVVSGSVDAVSTVVTRAREVGARAVELNVTGAFHSPLMRDAVPEFERHLAAQPLEPPRRRVVSTVTGGPLAADADIRSLLADQILNPVRFVEAATAAAKDADLLIEVGPGKILAGLASEFVDAPIVSTRSGDASLAGLLSAAGAAYAAGATVDTAPLFDRRLVRPFDPDRRPTFLTNPCELAPDDRASAPPPAPPAGESEDTLAVVRRLLAEATELPASAIADDARLLGDLHLNSITISEVAIATAHELGTAIPLAAPDLADPTVAEFAQTLSELGAAAETSDLEPAGVAPWVRAFTVELRETPISRFHTAPPLGALTVLGPDDLPIVAALRAAAPRDRPADAVDAVAVCLPPEADARHIPLLTDGARACLDGDRPRRFVLVQHGSGAASFARSLFLEHRDAHTTVVELPEGSDRADLVLAELAANSGFSEAHYDGAGVRREPRLALLPESPDGELPLGADDVLLVTGGGRGIGAECALALARQTGARLGVVGRASPNEDAELAGTLARFDDAGLTYRYAVADVRDAGAVAAAVAEVERSLGEVTAVIHAAGVNAPRGIAELTAEDFRATVAPKVDGAHNVLAAVRPDALKAFVTFGSAIAATGLQGEADYAVANEWQTHLTEQLQQRAPDCRCLAIEWSSWSEVGMGVRHGALERLAAMGVAAIPPSSGVETLLRLLGRDTGAVRVVVMGRFGHPPTLRLEEPELAPYRFLEQPRVFYPGIELVVDAELSVETDPYLADHEIRGVKVFPAVMGLEAMAQAAMALAESATAPTTFEDVAFERPVIVGALDATRTLRIAALARGPRAVEVAIRSDETDFEVDHFRALCRFDDAARPSAPLRGAAAVAVPLRGDELYETFFFQQGRFRRVGGYRELRATRALADIVPDGDARWFGAHMPTDLVLGDPGARDAAVHAGQASMPDLVRIPTRVERIARERDPHRQTALSETREHATSGDEYVVEVRMADAAGTVHELWTGVRCRAIGGSGGNDDWPASLYGPYLERALRRLIGRELTVAVDPADGARPDGAATCRCDEAGLVLVVAGDGVAACDLRRVGEDDEAPLGGLASQVADAAGDPASVAAARVDAACACAGRADLTLGADAEDGWVSFDAPAGRVLTWASDPRGDDGDVLVFAVFEASG